MLISFFIQSQSLFTLFLAPVIQVVKIGIFKIMRHKLCNCLPKLLIKNYLFFVLSNNMSKVLLSQSHQTLFTFKVCSFIVDTLYVLPITVHTHTHSPLISLIIFSQFLIRLYIWMAWCGSLIVMKSFSASLYRPCCSSSRACSKYRLDTSAFVEIQSKLLHSYNETYRIVITFN